ncbi:MAG: TIGR00266 family protein [Phycisphaerae bacterium]|nr:TIGR00266 family protein [Phycisphaerae bacterium]
MKYDIRGTTMQSVDVWLDAGESVYTESGGMCWMSSNIQMTTNAKGGVLKGLGRMMSGESFFMTTYTCAQGQGTIAFAPEFVGKVIPFELEDRQAIVCQKDGFMAAESSVELSVHFRKKLGTGFFGGEGFILQKLTGPGTAFVEVPGEVVEYDLAEGQTLKIDQSHLAAMDPSISFDITRIKGAKNVLFGGEGLFLATLTGPGKVWLQTMPFKNLIAKIISAMPSK